MRDELGISRRKLELDQIRARDPPHFLPEHGARRSIQGAPEEMKFDRVLGVRVRRLEHLLGTNHFDVEFLEHFASQGLVTRFARVALPAGEFPVAFEVRAGLPAGHQKTAVALDDGGDDDHHRACHLLLARPVRFGAFAPGSSFAGLKGNASQIEAIGQTRHLGFRAAQMTAPKSIRA